MRTECSNSPGRPTIPCRAAPASTIRPPMAIALWSSLAARAGISLSDEQLAQLDRYIDELLAANQRMNLTRIDTRDAAELGHVGDALTLLPYLPNGPHALAD